ncbi:MAG: hypothetical protein GY787_28890 [Alteromonadales bacterium]|nr:hypothetical protein [Alteromonadales bacterium]
MSINFFCVVMLFLQPLFVYCALFAKDYYFDDGDRKETQNESALSITPSFAYFYANDFWHAFYLLLGVSMIGILVAKILESKGKGLRPILFKPLISYILVWLVVFGFFYWVLSLLPLDNWYLAFWPSLFFLISMLLVFIIKVIELRFKVMVGLSNYLLMALCVVASFISIFGESFILCSVINAIILIAFGQAILTSDMDETSQGGISFFYGYIFIMGLPFSVICNVVLAII